MPDVMNRVVKRNTENLFMVPAGMSLDSAYKSKLYTLPSNGNALRGLSGDLALVDEAAFANKNLITHFLLPLLKVSGRKMLCISTPATDDTSFFSTAIQQLQEVRQKVSVDRQEELEFDVLVIEGGCVADCSASCLILFS